MLKTYYFMYTYGHNLKWKQFYKKMCLKWIWITQYGFSEIIKINQL